MSDKLNVELKLKVVDQASQKIDAATQRVKRANEEIKQSTKQSEAAQQQAKKKTAQASQEAALKAEMTAKRIAQAKKTLEIRTERELQAELRRTRQAYQLLAQSGTASARDLAKAKESLIRKERELRAEMGKTSMGQRVAGAGRAVAGVAAGVATGAMVLKEPVRKAMNYDRELAMVANTAYSDRDVAGRIAGKQELNQAVKNAVSAGGGTKEEALTSLNSLLASGMKIDTAKNLLPTLQKGATATGALPEELAAIVVSAMQNGIAEADIGKALDMSIAAGQAGQFELKDMAKWLPQQMALANQAGLKGIEGFQTLLVANQQSRVTAGTNDAAGNNLVNLLGKITSKETLKRFEGYEYIDKNGNVKGIDFVKSMEGYKKQGKNSLDAFMAIMDDVVGSNQQYIDLQTKLKSAEKQDQAKLLKEMTNLVEGSAIGEIISDKEALMALLAIRNNVQLGKDVNAQIDKSAGATETSYRVIADTNDHKTEQLKSTTEFAQMESLKGFNDLLGEASDKLNEYANQYPTLTKTLVGVATAVGALAAAAAAAAGSLSILDRVRGGKGGGSGGFGGLGDFFDKSKGGAKGAGSGLGGWFKNAGGKLLKFGGKALKLGWIFDLALHAGELNAGEAERLKMRMEEAKKQRNSNKPPAGNASALFQTQPFSVQRQNVPAFKPPRYNAPASIAPQFQSIARVMPMAAQPPRAAPPAAAPRAPQAAKQDAALSNSLAQITKQISALGAKQNTTQGKVAAVEGVLANYQADFKAFGQSISAALEKGLAAQSHTISNQITVEVDGSVVAQKVSEHQFNFNKRMG